MISYDDGEYEWIDCTKEKYELVKLSPGPNAPATSLPSAKQTPSVASANPKISAQHTQIPAKCIQSSPSQNKPARRSVGSKDDQEYIPKEIEEPSDEEVSLVMEVESSDDEPVSRMRRKVVLDDSSDSDAPIRKRASLPDLPSSKKPKKEDVNPLKAFSYQATPTSSKTTTPLKPRVSASPIKLSKKGISSADTSLVEEEGNSLDKKGVVILGAGEHTHDHTEWMQHPKDKYGHQPTDPNYDPTSLSIPPGYLKTCSNGMKQWWAVKQNTNDCVLLMKVGKFYETYHRDADIMVKELDLVYMKGEMAHAGFPEAAYSKFSNMLVNAGYRVARMEQTETPQMLKERNSRSSVKVC